MCAVSGLSETLCARTSDSQRVFTKVVRPVPEAPATRWENRVNKHRTSRNNTWKERLTNDHQGELDTLLDLVSSASAGERHFVESMSFGLLHLRAEQNRDEGES
jgi:hypothetical protein